MVLEVGWPLCLCLNVCVWRSNRVDLIRGLYMYDFKGRVVAMFVYGGIIDLGPLMYYDAYYVRHPLIPTPLYCDTL